MLSSQPTSPALPAKFRRELSDVLGDRVLFDPADCLPYGYDNSRKLALPRAVAFAETAAEIQSLVQSCRVAGLPIVARGRGTNTTGAAVPVGGGVVISLERMNRILRLSPGDRMVDCQGGCLNADVQRAAIGHGLFWPPDPTSAEFSTVAGNIACGAGGPAAVKYGTVRENVLGLSLVTGRGEIIKTGCHTTKGVVGLDLTRLIIGSEGGLGIITEATLKLTPKPTAKQTLRALYRSSGDAIEAVTRIMGQPTCPCALEFFDGQAVRLAQAWRDCGIPESTGAMLLIDVDGEPGAGLDNDLSAVARAAEAGPGLIELKYASTGSGATDLWAARKALSPALRKLAPRKINEDIVVPVTRLPELIGFLGELEKASGLQIVSFGHAGNGNLHVNLLADPSDASQIAAIDACLEHLFAKVLSLEGSLSGEHGIGLVKRAYVKQEVAQPALRLMHEIKSLFDPDGILNPGKTLPDTDDAPT